MNPPDANKLFNARVHHVRRAPDVSELLETNAREGAPAPVMGIPRDPPPVFDPDAPEGEWFDGGVFDPG